MSSQSKLGIAVAAFALLAGCGGDDASTGEGSGAQVIRAGGPLEVFTVNHPLEYFAGRIGGEQVVVEFPAPPDVDPAFWRPARDVLRRYQAADLILRNGADYAQWMHHVSLPLARVIDSSAAFADRLIEVPNAVSHSHGGGAAHSHAGLASTTWLDPKLAIEQARAILRAFVAARPDGRADFEQNFTALQKDLEALDARLAAAAAKIGDRALIGSHPVYQYLRRRYHLNLRELHWEPSDPISDAQWSELEAMRADHSATWMLWESTPLPESVARLEAAGLRSVVFDPCGNRPADGDFLSVMRANAAALETIAEAD